MFRDDGAWRRNAVGKGCRKGCRQGMGAGGALRKWCLSTDPEEVGVSCGAVWGKAVQTEATGGRKALKQEMPSLSEGQQGGQRGWGPVKKRNSSRRQRHRSEAGPDHAGLHFRDGSQ